MESRTVDVGALEKSIEGKLRSDSPLPAKCSIFKVPEVLRRHNPEAYQPDVVSIGPFHHGIGEKLDHMENVKHWYVSELLSRLDINLKTLIESMDVVEFGREARAFYADPLKDLNQNDFIEMMILDGCFLLELFYRSSCKFKEKKNLPEPVLCSSTTSLSQPIVLCSSTTSLSQPKEKSVCAKKPNYDDDSVFHMGCMVQYLIHDLLLLENQLPWFVLKRLYSHTIGLDKPDPATPLIKLVLDFFSIVFEMDQHCKCYSRYHDDNEIVHILGLIRSAIVDPFKEFESTKKPEDSMLPATLLAEAGVKFKGSEDDNIMNIQFEGGVLTIPRLFIAELTEPLFRNLIAFEQCYHGCDHKVTSYARLMDSLIASSHDVHLLHKNGILSNWLSDVDALNFFDKLYNDTLIDGFCYRELCGEVNEYQNHRRNEWRARLKREYLSNPWKITSLAAAFVLLVLTILQTSYTIQQYYHPRQ